MYSCSLKKPSTDRHFCRMIKKKVGKWVPFCCTLGGGVDLGLGITYEELCIKFSTTIRTTHKKPCIKFSSFFGHPTFFYRHFKKKIRIKIENFIFKLQPYKKIDSVENWLCVKIPVFPSFFFLFFSIFLKTVGKCLLFTFIMHQGYSLFHRKPPPNFEIEALFRLVIMLYTDTKKKKHTSLMLFKI
ncbi:hypothetical protein AGLY_017914 [Aphis glycines]|uniref:Uncharacterized protein n=1 Tax=Aphis glycines TaxID=307491 RepID=A0A6G0SUQ2_APHGL|nr:hypothetical protein AGLY_017914 [Aphis glycines]